MELYLTQQNTQSANKVQHTTLAQMTSLTLNSQLSRAGGPYSPFTLRAHTDVV